MAKSKKVALVEVFHSIQGEGYHTGRPAIFVRLAGCPLACEFAPGVVCDTPYQIANYKVTLDELFEDMVRPLIVEDWTKLPKQKALDKYRVPMLILTGGEPTTSPLFEALVAQANTAGFYTTVETNATRYLPALEWLDWRCASPKYYVPQTSSALFHNHNPITTPDFHPDIIQLMAMQPGEYRYVVGGQEPPAFPPFHPADHHYVSPAVLSDGSGEEWQQGFPGFAPGAVERCLEIVCRDPRWRISLQTHKFLGVR